MFFGAAVKWKLLQFWPRSFDYFIQKQKPTEGWVCPVSALKAFAGREKWVLRLAAAFHCLCYIHSTARGWVICHCTGTRQYTTPKITPTAITIVTDIQVNMTQNITSFKVHPNYSCLHSSFSCFFCWLNGCFCHHTSGGRCQSAIFYLTSKLVLLLVHWNIFRDMIINKRGGSWGSQIKETVL